MWIERHLVLLKKLRPAQKLDWSRAVIGSFHVRAARRGGRSGPSPADRAQPGSKNHVITDAQGVPLAVSLAGGNRNDVTQLLPLLEKRPAVAGVVGRPRRRPDLLLADRGCDHGTYRRLVRPRDPTGHRRTRSGTRQRPGHLPLRGRAHDCLAARLPPTADRLGTRRRHAPSLPRARHLPDHPPPRPTPAVTSATYLVAVVSRV
ncbi:transposase [Streptomyces sp. PRKS01-29]|nr:transposase [Streptomyces sabulosicollis]